MRKLALITGGTSGIGFATAEKLAASHDLALVYRENAGRAASAKTTLLARFPSTKIQLFAAELMDRKSCGDLFSAVERICGQAPEILVHSAGRIRESLFVVSDFADSEKLVGEHLLSAMALSHLALQEMYKKKAGRIILIGSTAAHRPAHGQAAYAAAKAGLEGFTRALSQEVFHRGIAVNCVAPGLIRTPLAAATIAKLEASGSERLATLGEPGQVAEVVAMLCSEKGAAISGQILPVETQG